MNNDRYLEELLVKRQTQYINTKSKFELINNEYKKNGRLEFAHNYYQTKMLLKKEIAALLVSKYFLYKEENKHLLSNEQGSAIYNIYYLIHKNFNTNVLELMSIEFKYHDFDINDFVKILLQENVYLFGDFLIDRGYIFKLDVKNDIVNYLNSDKHLQKNQAIINFFKNEKINDKKVIIEILSQALSVSQKLLPKNKYTDIAIKFNNIFPTVLTDKAMKEKDEMLKLFSNFASVHFYYSNIL